MRDTTVSLQVLIMRLSILFQGDSCFNGFQMSMLMAYLLRKKKISSLMSSYQIFRVTLQYLGNRNFSFFVSGYLSEKNSFLIDPFISRVYFL